MGDKYVRSSGSTPSAPYETWASAAADIKTAVAAAAAGETVWVDSAYSQTISADETIAFGASGIRIVSTNDTSNAPPTTYAKGATISTTTTGADVIFSGSHVFACYGLVISLGDSTDNCSLLLTNTAGQRGHFYDCDFTLGGSNAAAYIGPGASSGDVYCERCSFTWAATNQGLTLREGRFVFVDCDMSAGSTHPATLLEVIDVGAAIEFIGCDLSDIGTISEAAPSQIPVVLRNCALKSSYALISPTGYRGHVTAYDCAVAADDSHIVIHDVNYVGSTITNTSIYATDNLGDSNLSWWVQSTANATKANPYYSPWISVYHSGTSAITPYLECVRSGSSTAYNEDEVWVEVLVKDVGSGSTRANLYSNRSDPTGTGTANTSSSKGASDWFGENATSWFGQLALNASVTPAEPGYISMRVCIAKASVTDLYLDPQIRGLS
jgi:hypothetical protein